MAKVYQDWLRENATAADVQDIVDQVNEELDKKADKSEIPDISDINQKLETKENIVDHKKDIDNITTIVSQKQDILINQENIASINNQSLLLGGNIEIKSDNSEIDWTNINQDNINFKSNNIQKIHIDHETVQIYDVNGNSVMFVREDIRFTRTSDNAVTLIYSPADGTLKYGPTSAPSEIATKEDIAIKLGEYAMWTVKNTNLTPVTPRNINASMFKVVGLALATEPNDAVNLFQLEEKISNLDKKFEEKISNLLTKMKMSN